MNRLQLAFLAFELKGSAAPLLACYNSLGGGQANGFRRCECWEAKSRCLLTLFLAFSFALFVICVAACRGQLEGFECVVKPVKESKPRQRNDSKFGKLRVAE